MKKVEMGRYEKFAKQVTPPGVGLRRVGVKVATKVASKVATKVAGKIPKNIKVEGQKKLMKVIDGWTTKKKGHDLTKSPRGPKW